ncbi:hypothetical protein [Pseudomonas juntendi]|uniref:hypothetical protein n=1 Tax=Pseudomonas juntendi TaxID=2666183 RepID=UPI0018D5D0DE|nr:hypothetical protein [Pseudomonas juntendi]MBH3375285.1 hypothetical protein [Pseudomonas juntendi]
MNVLYTVNGQAGSLLIPATYLLVARPEDLAELVTSEFWRNHQTPPECCVVHLHNVEDIDLGSFEVRTKTRPVFTAKAINQG